MGSAGHVRPTRAADADATVEPAVRPPLETVGKGVAAGGLGAKTVDEDLRWAAGFVAVGGNEQEMRWAHCVDAAEAALDAGEHLEIVGEYRASIETPVVVGVLEDNDAIAELEVEALLVVRVSVVLRDPETTALVPAHRDGILDVGFGGEQRGFEPGWQVHQLQQVRWGGEGLVGDFLIIRRSGEGGVGRREQANLTETEDESGEPTKTKRHENKADQVSDEVKR